MKIIRVIMDNDRPADDLLCPEAPGQHLHTGFPAISQQRRQIPRVLWVRCAAGIKVPAGVWESVPGAVPSLVDMKPEESGFCPGQTGDLRFHQNAVATLKKPDCPAYLGEIPAAADLGSSINTSCLLLHSITPIQSMRQERFLIDKALLQCYIFPVDVCKSRQERSLKV